MEVFVKISDVTCPACKKKMDNVEIEGMPGVVERVVDIKPEKKAEEDIEPEQTLKTTIIFPSGTDIHCCHCKWILNLVVTDRGFDLLAKR